MRLMLVVASLGAAGPLLAQERTPPEVTDSAVARGRELFHGAGGCSACHGDAGVGTDSGPALAQGIWLHGSDDYPAILGRVAHGVPRDRSLRGVAMPVRGWQGLSDAELRDVAAYVWRLSRSTPARPGLR